MAESQAVDPGAAGPKAPNSVCDVLPKEGQGGAVALRRARPVTCEHSWYLDVW